ncbi:MAG: N-acetylglucosaminyl deacetylase, LmbE family [Gemmatimonadetes bacterium]|nr:N-acetylglucosaminyl deacetylase, LmbE family [Gemmatimonadota bacterium]
MTPRNIACVLAHPDDETFCVGGIIAKNASAGHRIDLFCATNGDAGKSAAVPVSSREELAEIRKRELAAAARILGIQSVETPGYPDGTLHTIDPAPLIDDIIAFLRRHTPAIVLAFGPDGGPPGHRDHRAMSRATTAAFFLSGLHRTSRLFYHSWQFPLPDPRLTVEPIPPTAGIDVRAWKATKRAAFEAHATQQLSAAAFETSFVDVERLAFAAGVPQPRAMIDELFEGLSS